jgi:phytoene desaturase
MLTDIAPRRPGTAAPADDPRPRAVVIGAGFGGLAAAVRLGARGYRVSVLDRLEQAGGRASVFRQDGFVFDAGPTIITLPFVFEELWAKCGRRMSDDVDLRPLEPFYKLMFADGSHFTCSGDEERARAEVARLSPGDLRGYEGFLRESEAIYHFAFEWLGQIPFHQFTNMLRAAPWFARHRAERSVFGLAGKYFRDPRLRIAFSFHPLFIGGNPLRATALYALVSHLERKYGVHFAMGGTGAIVRGLVGLIERLGGEVRTHSEVSRIRVENGTATGVTLASGETIPAAVVVSNADPGTTYGTLMEGQRKRWTPKKLDGSRWSMSLIVWYFGTKKRYEHVDHHTIVLGPRYEGLLTDIFDRKVLADDFSLYVHRPTASDPSLAPEGCDTFYALSPVPHLGADVEWATMAETYRRRMAAELDRRLLPGFEREIVTSKLFTPLDFRDRLASPLGAAFSLEPTLFQSAWFRPHNRSEEAKNLFLVGAGTHPGAGVPGVVSSAKIVDELVPHASTFRR